jgi:hypothetical protein
MADRANPGAYLIPLAIYEIRIKTRNLNQNYIHVPPYFSLLKFQAIVEHL